MSKILKSLLKENKPETMLDEIRSKVLARYSEIQGLESEQFELEATLEALQDMTGLPRQEIDQISKEVQANYQDQPAETMPLQKKPETQPLESGLAFEKMIRRIESLRRGFINHLIPYLAVNGALIVTNLVTSRGFPWSMFPVFFWGIGLASHYFAAVRWPQKDLDRKILGIKNQLQQILVEVHPTVLDEKRPGLFSGVYRLLINEASPETVEKYLTHADAGLQNSQIKMISAQISALQRQYVLKKN